MGKLIDKIERTQKSSGPRLGFAAPSASKQASLLVIAVVPAAKAELALEAAQAGADAVLVKGEITSTQSLKLPSSAIGGAIVPGGTSERPKADFLIVDNAGEATLLNDSEEADVVLSVSIDISDQQLRVLEALPVDALLLPAAGSSPTVEDLIALYRITRATSKPTLAHAKTGTDASVLRVLRDAGISGFVTEAGTAAGIAEVKRLRRALDSLPAKKTRKSRGRDVASVGSSMSMGFGREAPSREPEPDEDDDEP